MLRLYYGRGLAHDPAPRSIHASHALALAATESRRVRRLLIDGDEYRSMFPHVALRPDESAVEHWATSADGRCGTERRCRERFASSNGRRFVAVIRIGSALRSCSGTSKGFPPNGAP